MAAAAMVLILGGCALPRAEPQELARIPAAVPDTRADYPLLVCVYAVSEARYGYEVYVTAETRCAERARLAARITFQAAAGASYIVRYRPLAEDGRRAVRFTVTDESTGSEVASAVASR